MQKLSTVLRRITNTIRSKIGLVPLYIKGAPNPYHNKIGFVSSVALTPSGEFSTAIKSVAKSLRKPVQYTDEEGYENQITAAAIHPEFNWKAWIESREKEVNYYVDILFKLKIMKDEQIVHTWLVETYNPYFGCRVGYMQWHEEYLIIVYREKHQTYICSIGTDYKERFVTVADNWVIKSNILYFIGEGQGWLHTNIAQYDPNPPEGLRPDVERRLWKTFTENQVERITLPDLTPLPPITKTAAREIGVLDGGNEE